MSHFMIFSSTLGKKLLSVTFPHRSVLSFIPCVIPGDSPVLFSCLYSQYNFVGRILGPRGLTAKQLEAETGCKIMVRGKSSMRDKKKVNSSAFLRFFFHTINTKCVLLLLAYFFLLSVCNDLLSLWECYTTL